MLFIYLFRSKSCSQPFKKNISWVATSPRPQSCCNPAFLCTNLPSQSLQPRSWSAAFRLSETQAVQINALCSQSGRREREREAPLALSCHHLCCTHAVLRYQANACGSASWGPVSGPVALVCLHRLASTATAAIQGLKLAAEADVMCGVSVLVLMAMQTAGLLLGHEPFMNWW